MIFGQRADGTMAHVSEVVSGRACACVCPSCDAVLIARKGRVNEHHFAHEGRADGTPCRTGPETALHKLAKEILAARLCLDLPRLEIVEKDDRWTGYEGGPYAFDAALVERRLGAIVPDVIVRKGERDLLVEFMVTHACGPEKLEEIRRRDLATVEIDLSGLSRDVDRAGIAEAILSAAPRRWLHNPRSAIGRGVLDHRRQQREDARAARVRTLAEAYRRHDRDSRAMKPSGQAHARLTADGFGKLLDLPVDGAGCFRIAAGDWQALCFETLLSGHARAGGAMSAMELRDVVEAAGGIRPDYARLKKDLAAALKTGDATFAAPYEAVKAWADAAARKGVLRAYGDGRWGATQEAVEHRRKVALRRELPKMRLWELKELVDGILRDLPGEETAGFVFETWMTTTLPFFAHAPSAALSFDDREYERFLAPLRQLPTDLRFHPTAMMDLHGLPLEGRRDRRLAEVAEAKARSETERAARLEKEAGDREEAIRRTAVECMGNAAEAWLAASVPGHEASPIAIARGGRDGLDRAAGLAEEVRRRIAAEDRREQEAQAARAGLRSAARNVFDDARLELYLRSAHPLLGGLSPMAFCVNQTSLERCKATTLPGRKRGR